MEFDRVKFLVKIFFNGYRYARRTYSSRENLRAVENEALRRAIHIAYHETDFYRERFDRAGIKPGDIRTIEDLSLIPITTKKDLADNFAALIPRSMDKNRSYLLRTSGSTGNPIQVYKDEGWVTHVVASAIRLIKMHTTVFPKTALILDSKSRGAYEKHSVNFYKYIGARISIISVQQDIEKIMTDLEICRPDYIVTYTGVMRELARLRKAGRGRQLRLRKVALTGEILDDFTRAYIEDAFDCLCYSTYISTEGGPMASECVNKKLHANIDANTLEIVDSQGQPVKKGEDGFVVMTCHDGGHGTPVIRYSGCADMSRWTDETCDCGYQTPILSSIRGRADDAIHLPDGRVCHAFNMTIPMEKIQRGNQGELIRQYQIVQHDFDRIDISLVRNADAHELPEDLLHQIGRVYQEQLGPLVNISVKEVPSISRSSSSVARAPLVLSRIAREKLSQMNV